MDGPLVKEYIPACTVDTYITDVIWVVAFQT